MRLSCIMGLLVWAIAVVFIAGCDGGKPSESTAEPGSAEKKTTVLNVADLPPLGDYIRFPLDDGRVQIAPPENYVLSSRSKAYIIECKGSQRASYPLIRVTAEDYETVLNISDEATAKTFAQQRAAAFEAEGVTLEKEVTPLRVGDNWGIAYVRQRKTKKNTVDQIFFETVASGRKYKYEMRMLTGHREKVMRSLFSMVGGTKFLRPAPAKKPEGEASKKDDAAKTP